MDEWKCRRCKMMRQPGWFKAGDNICKPCGGGTTTSCSRCGRYQSEPDRDICIACIDLDRKTAIRTSGPVVYFFQAGGSAGPVKIGFSRSPEAMLVRLKTTQTYNHKRISVLGWYYGSWHFEKVEHSRFASSRLMGEWFSFSPELLEHVRSMDAARRVATSAEWVDADDRPMPPPPDFRNKILG